MLLTRWVMTRPPSYASSSFRRLTLSLSPSRSLFLPPSLHLFCSYGEDEDSVTLDYASRMNEEFAEGVSE